MECFVDYVSVGKKIRQARKAKRWTQAKLAEEVGCSTANITNVEKANTKLSLNMLVRIIDVLSLSADEILGSKRAPSASALSPAEAQIREIWSGLSPKDAQCCQEACADFCAAFSKRFPQV